MLAMKKTLKGHAICSRGGAAVDFLVEDEDMNEVADWIINRLPFDRLYIYESERPIHVSCGPENSRAAYVMIKNASRGRIPRPYALRRHQSADGLAIRLG